jgi:hypothetical protein
MRIKLAEKKIKKDKIVKINNLKIISNKYKY